MIAIITINIDQHVLTHFFGEGVHYHTPIALNRSRSNTMCCHVTRGPLAVAIGQNLRVQRLEYRCADQSFSGRRTYLPIL